MISGILNVNKPSGITSYDVVRAVKYRLNLKKVGHCGTLDPLARGVLLVCFGDATKLFECLSKEEKTYETEMILGFETDTGDTEGKIINCFDPLLNRFNPLLNRDIPPAGVPPAGRIEEVLYSFIGEIEQLPPMYSAVKHRGRKLYEFAREGKTVERKLRRVKIYNIRLIYCKYPYVKFIVESSRGTYIRSLVVDIGKKLGVYATVSGLIRRRIGPFSVDESIDYQEIKDISCEELLGVAKKHSGLLGGRSNCNYRFF